MWFKKIKKRKMQHFLISFILMSATAIMLACTSFTLETKKFVNQYYEYDQCPITFDLVTSREAAEELQTNAQIKEFVDHIEIGTSHYIQDEFYQGTRKLNNDSILVHSLDDKSELGYPLALVEGEEENGPADGEIWICHVYADAMNLQVGDQFSIGKEKECTYTVSAIVDTSECCSGFLDNYPCFVNTSEMQKLTGTEVTDVCLYAKDDTVSIKEMKEVLPAEYKNSIFTTLDRDSLKSCISILANIFGGIGIAAALIILVISVVVIRYMVRSVIDKEYHMIGIYKAVGKSNAEINRIYFTSYMLTGLVGILLGIVLGRPLGVYLGREIINGMQGYQLSGITDWLTVLAVVFMVGVLAFNLWYELRKIKKITPIKAMSAGTRSTKKRITQSLIPNAHSSAAMAINQIMKNKRMSILIILVLTISYYVCLIACSIDITMNHYEEDKNIWENMPIFSGYIKVSDQEDVVAYLEQSEDVQDYVGVDFYLDSVDIEFVDCDIAKGDANPMAYSDFTEERYQNVPLTAGRICTNPYEVAASNQFLSQTGHSVGDYLTIKVNGTEKNFLIVGSYATVMRGGVTLYFQEDDLDSLGAKVNMSQVLFFLKDGVTYEEFAQDFNSHFQNSKIYQEFESLTQEKRTITEISQPVSIVIFAAFAAFSVLNIINVVYTMNRDNRKRYGILKSFGFSNGYICRQVLFQIGVESAIAVLFTVVLQEYLSPVLFSLACGVRYIYKPAWLTIAVCAGISMVILFITATMLLSVRKITPVELMEE